MDLLTHIKPSSPDPLHQADVVLKRPLSYQKMENLIKEMQDPEHGVPVRSQKLFLTSIPAAFAGYDIIEWLMERLNIEDSAQAIHLANLLCQHGYFFPVTDNKTLVVKDDSSLYRFQTPYYWPSQVPCLDNVDYAIFLAKRTLRNKQKHGLDDHELEAFNNLRKTLSQKWDFISMQADEQIRITKERKKVEKMVSDSQEKAFWRVLRPPPTQTACIEAPPMWMADFHANKEGVKKIRQNNILEDLRAEVELLRNSCIRTRIKVSQALESLASHCQSYYDHEPFLVPRQPSNPWQTDDPCYWIINAQFVDVPMERRVKRWAISMEDLVFDPTGLREFTAYLKKEYCHENIRFWTEVLTLRSGPISKVKARADEIYNTFLCCGAPCEINIDMRTMEKVQKELNKPHPSRFTFDPAAEHVYTLLLKKDCYPRFIRSEHYKSLVHNAIQPATKKRFFSFGMQKKKSSATNPPIFPVGLQSATAGVGEVLKATDELMMVTAGRDLLSTSIPDVDRISTLSECPYRGDLVPDEKKDSDSLVKSKQNFKSEGDKGGMDDCCPWEMVEKLPEKEKPEVKPKPEAPKATKKQPASPKPSHPPPDGKSVLARGTMGMMSGMAGFAGGFSAPGAGGGGTIPLVLSLPLLSTPGPTSKAGSSAASTASTEPIAISTSSTTAPTPSISSSSTAPLTAVPPQPIPPAAASSVPIAPPIVPSTIAEKQTFSPPATSISEVTPLPSTSSAISGPAVSALKPLPSLEKPQSDPTPPNASIPLVSIPPPVSSLPEPSPPSDSNSSSPTVSGVALPPIPPPPPPPSPAIIQSEERMEEGGKPTQSSIAPTTSAPPLPSQTKPELTRLPSTSTTTKKVSTSISLSIPTSKTSESSETQVVGPPIALTTATCTTTASTTKISAIAVELQSGPSPKHPSTSSTTVASERRPSCSILIKQSSGTSSDDAVFPLSSTTTTSVQQPSGAKEELQKQTGSRPQSRQPSSEEPVQQSTLPKAQKMSEKSRSVSKESEKENLVEICPWDHENGTKAATTTFVKTYSTLGYL